MIEVNIIYEKGDEEHATEIMDKLVEIHRNRFFFKKQFLIKENEQ